MTSSEKKTWEKPSVKELGDAKEIIKGFTPGDPKIPGGGDGACVLRTLGIGIRRCPRPRRRAPRAAAISTRSPSERC